MSNELREKEKEVEISKLKYSVLEYELRLLKKMEEVERIKVDLEKTKDRLKNKKEGK